MRAGDPQPPFFLGIDLGGTNIKSGVVDDNGRSVSSVSVGTNAHRGPVEGLGSLEKAGRLAVEASGLRWDDIAAVGLGSPGTMDLENGMLLDPPNLPGWDNLPIRRLLGDRLGKPTVLQNDASAAAFGEYWSGGGRDTRSLVLFTLGTGIGGGIVQEGRVIEGRHSHGAECGHIIIQMENGRRCSCGGYGHLEAYASATALVKRAREALERDGASALHDALSRDALTSRSIAEASARGDALARRLMRETARFLAVGAVCLMHTIDPDVILFGGGMIAAGELFLADIREDIH
ncbi:MAG: ROK family protein, partial [Planctomycetia bacterium]|nr:ROK family protein [Planctomycetia bacterium]